MFDDLLQPGHVVQFYDREQSMIDKVARRTARALRSAVPCVLVATGTHLQQFEQRMRELAFPLDELRLHHRYIALDAAEMLGGFMDGLSPDRKKFHENVGTVVREAAALSATGLVSIFGEMVALLCQTGNAAGAIALEELWNELADRYSFSLFCAYPLELFGVHSVGTVSSICEQHALCFPAESPL